MKKPRKPSKPQEPSKTISLKSFTIVKESGDYEIYQVLHEQLQKFKENGVEFMGEWELETVSLSSPSFYSDPELRFTFVGGTVKYKNLNYSKELKNYPSKVLKYEKDLKDYEQKMLDFSKSGAKFGA